MKGSQDSVCLDPHVLGAQLAAVLVPPVASLAHFLSNDSVCYSFMEVGLLRQECWKLPRSGGKTGAQTVLPSPRSASSPARLCPHSASCLRCLAPLLASLHPFFPLLAHKAGKVIGVIAPWHLLVLAPWCSTHFPWAPRTIADPQDIPIA